MEEYKNLIPLPQVKVFRFQAPLYYANKESFLKSLYNAVGVEPFLELTKRRKAEKKAKEMSLKQAKANGDRSNGEIAAGLVQRELDFHTIVLDCSAIPFIDSTGTATFQVLLKEYKEIGVSVLLANCSTTVIDTLQKAQFFGKNGTNMSSLLFHTVHSAVLHANSRSAAAESRPEDSEV